MGSRRDNVKAKQLGADLTIPVEQLPIQGLYGRLARLLAMRAGLEAEGLPSLARHAERRVMERNILAEEARIGLPK